MNHEQHLEGGFGPNNRHGDVYIPPSPRREVIIIRIKTPVSSEKKKQEPPPITFEGGDGEPLPDSLWTPRRYYPEHDGLRERQNEGSRRIQQRIDRERARENGERRDN